MEIKPLNFNKPQKRLVVTQPNEATNVFSRAVGKSFIIAYIMRLIDETMPGSKWGIVGETFKQMKVRTLPSTLNGLRHLGYKLDLNLFVNKRPHPKYNIPPTIEAPMDYENFITLPKGAGFALISLDGNGGSARGLNLDGLITDETLNINLEKFNQDVMPAKRGNRRLFGHIPWHLGVFHFTSMPYAKDQMWILRNGDYYEKDGYDFTSLRNEIIKLELKFIDNKDPQYRLKVWGEIAKLKQQLRFYKSKDGHLYHEGDIFDNILNIGIKYVEQQRRQLTDFEFVTEILNKRPGVIEGGFYALIEPRIHLYSEVATEAVLGKHDFAGAHIINLDSRFDMDCMRGVPLRLAVDWGGNISALTIAQSLNMEYRFLKDMYVKHPQLIDELADKFIKYYFFHSPKEIDFIPDLRWGNRKTPDAKLTYNQQFISKLRKAGWNVRVINVGLSPSDSHMYLLWHMMLKEDDSRMVYIRINKHNCSNLIKSLLNTPIKMGNKGIEKDKSSERSTIIPQEEATHFSDTADQHILSIGKTYLTSQSTPVPNAYN